MVKKLLRKEFLAKRILLSEADQQKQVKKIAAQFTGIHLTQPAFAVSYKAISAKKEIDPASIEQAITLQFPECQLCYPKTGIANDMMEAIAYQENMAMITNVWGIAEPESNAIVDPQQIDLIIVPLLVFDRQGYRVGYGKGFYDRFITRCRQDVVTVGLSFFEPIEKIEDLNIFDMPMKYCITPQQVYRF